MMAKVYYKHGPFEVTSSFVKARNRSIQLATLESVDLSRHLFFGALSICGGLVCFGLVYGDLLYTHEIIILILIGGAGLYLSWNIGTFTIYSKLTGSKGWSVTWWRKPLRDMRTAVERALEERGQRHPSSGRGGAVTHDDHEDDDDDD